MSSDNSDRNGSSPAPTTRPKLRLNKEKVKVLDVRAGLRAGLPNCLTTCTPDKTGGCLCTDTFR